MKILLIHTHSIIIKLHPSVWTPVWSLTWFSEFSKVSLKWTSKISSKSCRFLLLDIYLLKGWLGCDRLFHLHLRLSVDWLLTWRSLRSIKLRWLLYLRLLTVHHVRYSLLILLYLLAKLTLTIKLWCNLRFLVLNFGWNFWVFWILSIKLVLKLFTSLFDLI